MRAAMTGGWFAALALTLGLAACGTQATQPEDSAGALVVEAGDTVRLAVGGTARVRGTQVLVAFRRVDEDSRCPIDALCVWPGDAQVRLDLTIGRAAWMPHVLHTYLEPRQIEFQGYRFRVLELTPAPVSTATTKPEDYRLVLEVTRR